MAVLISIVALRAVLHAGCVEKKAILPAGVTLVVGGPHAAEALGVARLASQGCLIPVLGGGTFLARYTLSMAVHPQAFLTGRAAPRR